jgi:Glycosyl hydrolase family 26
VTDPLAAAVAAAQNAQTYATAALAAKDQALATANATITEQAARIAELQAQLPRKTRFGVNASSKTEHDANSALLNPDAWRYYIGPGKPLGPPPYPLADGQLLAPSDKIPMADKAAGKADAALLAYFKSLPTDRDNYYDPLHEHDAKIAKGEVKLADFIAGFQRAAKIARTVGSHIKMTTIYTDWCFKPASGRNWLDSWPGDEFVDVIGIDAYVGPSYTAPADMPHMFDAVVAAAKSKGKPWGVFEAGVDKGLPNRPALLQQYATLARQLGAEVVFYFNLYNWVLDKAGAAAWRAGQVAA